VLRQGRGEQAFNKVRDEVRGGEVRLRGDEHICRFVSLCQPCCFVLQRYPCLHCCGYC
jgi:hypothetical protein